MTLRLLFNPSSIPRTTTREEWHEMWRWKREAEKIIRAELDERTRNLAIYGTTHPEIYKTVLDELVNPPLLVRE